MKIPNTLKIGGHEYTVKPITTQLRDISGEFGACDHNKHQILLDKALPQSRQECTLLHEIIEAINEQHELMLEHAKICTLEQALYQVFKDNKIWE